MKQFITGNSCYLSLGANKNEYYYIKLETFKQEVLKIN
jgi:hypothetical protein